MWNPKGAILIYEFGFSMICHPKGPSLNIRSGHGTLRTGVDPQGSRVFQSGTPLEPHRFTVHLIQWWSFKWSEWSDWYSTTVPLPTEPALSAASPNRVVMLTHSPCALLASALFIYLFSLSLFLPIGYKTYLFLFWRPLWACRLRRP